MAVTAQWLFHNYTMIENYTFLRNESQPLKFLYFRQVVVSAKCLFGEKSVRQTVRSTKCSFDKVSVGKMPVRQSVFRQNDFPQSVFRQNVRVPKSIVCHIAPVRLPYHRREGGFRSGFWPEGRPVVLGRLWAKHWTPLDAQNLEGKENY